MEGRIDGKVALVTGSTHGLGRAIAEELARSGAAGLVVTGRDAERGEAEARQLTEGGTPAIFVQADLIDPDAPERLLAACLDRFGRIDALVNAAALTDRASMLDGDAGLWDKLFAVNARAPYLMMQHAIKAMRARGEGGAIVNILSINVHCGEPDLAIYSATKAAVALLTKNAANAHRFDRIRVNGIILGWTLTHGERKMQAETLGKGEDWLEQANAEQPFGRLVMPEEAANLAAFLLSDACGPMTGALIDQEQWVAGSR